MPSSVRPGSGASSPTSLVDGAEFGGGLHPDDHPSHCPHHAVDGVYKAIPSAFAKIHRRHLTPTVSTLTMGGISIVLYVIMNYVSAGTVIADSVSALGVMIAFYYGLTGFSCVWYYRNTLTESARNLWIRGILPLARWPHPLVRMGYNLLVLLEQRQTATRAGRCSSGRTGTSAACS
jgi:hypothetical protein